MEEQKHFNQEVLRRLALIEQTAADSGTIAKDHALGMRELAGRILALEQDRERMQAQIDTMETAGESRLRIPQK